MELRSVAALIEASRKMPIWEAILCSNLEEDTPEQRAASLEKMQMLWQVMQDSAAGYDGSQRSLSGLSGGDGEKYTQMLSSGKMMCGDIPQRCHCHCPESQRVQCLYETHCGSTYCRLLRGDSGGADSLPERIPRYTGGGDAPRPLRDRRLWKYHC